MPPADLRSSVPPRTLDRARAATLLTVVACQGLLLGDVGAVVISLPAVRDDFGADVSATQLVLALYSLSFAVTLVTGGRLGDVYGRRRLLLAGLAGFVGAAAASAVAPTVGLLMAARLVAGVAAALVAAQVLAVIQVTAPEPPARARAMGQFGIATAVGVVVGQVGAGLLLRTDVAGAGWRAVFAAELAFGLAALAATVRAVPESRASGGRRLDPLGVVLLGLGVILVVHPLIAGRSNGWEPWVWWAMAAAVPVLVAFTAHERRLVARGGAPLLDLGLFRAPSWRAGLILAFLFSATVQPLLFLFTLVSQIGLGHSALSAALAMSSQAVGYSVGSRASAAMVARHGPAAVLAGLGVAVLGTVVLGGTALVLGGGLALGALVPGLFVLGVGQGSTNPLVLGLALRDVPVDQAGSAGGAYSTAQQVAYAVGVAAAGVIYYAVLDGGGPDGHARAFGVTMLTGGLAPVLVGAALAAGLVRAGRQARRETGLDTSE